MTRPLLVATLLAALVPAFFALVADVDAQTVMKAQTGTLLLVAIAAILVVTSAITAVFLFVFGRAAQHFSRYAFPFFIGWKFLRSQRSSPTLGTRLARAREAASRLPARHLAARAGGGRAPWGAPRLLADAARWNALADAVSPSFATASQLALMALGACLLGAAALTSLARLGRASSRPTRFRLRSAVTLPTFISIVGVAVGLWALIVVLGVMHGLQSDLRDKILRTNAHVIIEPSEVDGELPDARAIEAAARAIPEVTEAHALVRGEVMMSFQGGGGAAYGVVVKGLPDAALLTGAALTGQFEEGRADFVLRPELLAWDRGRYPLLRSRRRAVEPEVPDGLDGAEPAFAEMDEAPVIHPGVILGAELARTLHATIGDEITLIAPDADIGPTGLRPRTAPFRVAAIFRTGMYEYDQKLAYTTVDAAQAFFNLGDARNAFEAHVKNPEDAAAIAASLSASLGPSVTVATFAERNANLFSALMLERLIMLIILGFIIFVASLLIVISLVMFVVEKMREVAVLKALGARNGQVVGGFVTIGGVIAGFGILIGLPLGVGTCLLVIASGLSLPREFYIRTLPVKLDPVDITVFALAALGICLVATIYPALRAARLQPADGIRHG
jgi:lipoprotein-releasing system permease protein